MPTVTATPLFILGRHRSGTTWLSNVLAAHPEIYAQAHERHWGVHESAYFSHLVRYCNHGRTTPDLRAIKCLFEGSDFFALSALNREHEIVGRGPAAYFRSVMEEAAGGKNARYWLEKTPAHTLHARELAKAFPDARFVAIVRHYRPVVASNVHAFGNPKSPAAWFWQSIVTAVYEKVIRSNRVWTIRYETLVGEHEPTIRAILDELGVASRSIPQTAFPRNTFYKEAAPVIVWWQAAAMVLGRWLIQPFPPALVEIVVVRLRNATAGALPNWFFRAPVAPATDRS